MFAVVEWFEEDGRKEHTCLVHVQQEQQAKTEKAVADSDFVKGFTNEIIEFDEGDPCPMCRRIFNNWW